MIEMINNTFENKWVIFPEKYIEIKNNNTYAFLPWYILNNEQIEFWSKYLFDTYNKNLYPIARKDGTDDFACWEKNKGERVQIIHTFSSLGWEQREVFDDFGQWYEWALQQK